MSSDYTPAVGLDFGTSTTLIASADGVVPIGESTAWMPSLVGYRDDGSVAAGEQALDVPDEQLVRSVKRSITEGRSFFSLDTPTGYRDIRADDLMVGMLREVMSRGAARGVDLGGGRPIRLGCPAMWDGSQRRRLVELANRAGIPATLGHVVDEPVAAGIAWLAQQQPSSERQRVLVFDMGGGTLDIAVLEVRGAQVSVLAALGVAEAGDALDAALAEDLEYVLAAQGVDVATLERPRRARARLAYAAREAKIALSTEEEIDVKLSRREFGISSFVYRREQLNACFSQQMDRADQYVATALRVARLTEAGGVSAYELARTPIDELIDAIDVIVLSGGMSQIPYVAQRLQEFFSPDTRIEMACSPSENAVAAGLALTPRYGGINMHRPAFDILLEWDSGREQRSLYEAFTPLIELRQIARGGSDLRFIRSGAELSLPGAGTGRLKVVSHSDDRLRATLAGASLDGFPVELSGQKFEFSIYPDGRIRLTDGAATHDGLVENWR